MLDITQLKLDQLVLHWVGNKLQEEDFRFSKKPLDIADPEVKGLVMKYLLSPFKDNEYYHFQHETDLALNEIYTFASKIFDDPDALFLQSINICKHLYEQSTHPKVKGGELYLAYLKDCIVDGEVADAIGLFKSETKETYLRVYPAGDGYEINYENGININKLDKGCLIFNLEKEKGFKVCTVDNVSKSGDAQYWKDHFLKVRPREDAYHHTQNCIKLCSSFIQEKIKEDFEVSRIDEVDMMNKSVKYFKEKTVFDIQEFATEVIGQPEIAEAFKDYKKNFSEERNVQMYDEFDISTSAVKKGAKVFKSIIKLDKNFHIYVHGNRELIVKGFDPAQGMNYYQLFFKGEE